MKATILLLLLSLLASPSLLIQALAEPVNESITVMSLNIYGWKTMPKHSADYAQLIKSHNTDILAIQEGVEDWQLKHTDIHNKLPTNYQRAITLNNSLGMCWRHQFQIFLNYCQGNRFIDSGRFDLTDGPNATRTGEYALIEKANKRYYIVNVHWEHESAIVRAANAEETAAQLKKMNKYPKILLGDFNSHCDGKQATLVKANADMSLLKNAGIDCLFVKDLTGKAKKIAAHPSDHPAIVATLVSSSRAISIKTAEK